MSVLSKLYYKKLPIKDFAGNNLVYLDNFAKINMTAFKTLIYPQTNNYGDKAVKMRLFQQVR